MQARTVLWWSLCMLLVCQTPLSWSLFTEYTAFRLQVLAPREERSTRDAVNLGGITLYDASGDAIPSWRVVPETQGWRGGGVATFNATHAVLDAHPTATPSDLWFASGVRSWAHTQPSASDWSKWDASDGSEYGWVFQWRYPVTADDPAPAQPATYALTTGADAVHADPISWRLFGYDPHREWVLLDSRLNYTTPTARATLTAPALPVQPCFLNATRCARCLPGDPTSCELCMPGFAGDHCATRVPACPDAACPGTCEEAWVPGHASCVPVSSSPASVTATVVAADTETLTWVVRTPEPVSAAELGPITWTRNTTAGWTSVLPGATWQATPLLAAPAWVSVSPLRSRLVEVAAPLETLLSAVVAGDLDNGDVVAWEAQGADPPARGWWQLQGICVPPAAPADGTLTCQTPRACHVTCDLGFLPSTSNALRTCSLAANAVTPAAATTGMWDNPVTCVSVDSTRPTVTSLSQSLINSASPPATTAITIFGTNFDVTNADIVSLDWDGVPCLTSTVLSDTQISCTLPTNTYWDGELGITTVQHGRVATGQYFGVINAVAAAGFDHSDISDAATAAAFAGHFNVFLPMGTYTNSDFLGCFGAPLVVGGVNFYGSLDGPSIIDCALTGRVVTIMAPASFHHITFTQGVASSTSGALAAVDAGAPGTLFRDVQFLGGVADAGGCLAVDATGVTVTRSSFTGCNAWLGGAIAASQPLSVTDTTFSTVAADDSVAAGAVYTGGAIYTSSGGLTVTGSTFSSCSSQETGGAIAVAAASSGTVRIADSTFSQILADTDGGTIHVAAGGAFLVTLEMDNVQVSESSAAAGDGGVVWAGDRVSLDVQGGAITTVGVPAGSGGAFYASTGTAVTWSFADVAITEASALIQGGAFFLDTTSAASALAVTGTRVFTAQAGGGGGALQVHSTGHVDMEIRDATFAACESTGSGGAVALAAISVSALTRGARFKDCGSEASGGGMYFAGGAVTAMIHSTSVRDCSVKDHGGFAAAIGTAVNVSAVVLNSKDTAAEDRGGCLYAAGSTCTDSTLVHSVIQKSDAGDRGGGMFANGGPTNIQIRHAAIRRTQSASHGGGLCTGSGLVTLEVADALFDQTTSGDRGGGIFLLPSSMGFVTIQRCLFRSAMAAAQGALHGGGGIGAANVRLNVLDTVFHGCASMRGGGIHVDSGDVSLLPMLIERVTFDACQAFDGGGGMYIGNFDRADGDVYTMPTKLLEIANSTFIDCEAASRGGAISTATAMMRLHHSRIDSCRAVWGGAMIFRAASGGSPWIVVEDTVMHGNEGLQGGAIAWSPVSHIHHSDGGAWRYTGAYFRRNVFSQNVATFGATVIIDTATRQVFMKDNLHIDNAASIVGGGLYVGLDAYVEVEDDRFTDNYAGQLGGAIFVYATGDMVAQNMTLQGNVAGGRGGALASLLGELWITNSRFLNNVAGSRGGAISVIQAIVELTGCEVAGNAVVGMGGGIEAQESFVQIISGLVTGNSAGSSGGGLFGGRASSIEIMDSVLEGNSATMGGALFAAVTHITDSRVEANEATEFGGGLFLADPEDITLIILPDHARRVLDRANLGAFPFNSTRLTGVTLQHNVAGVGGGGLVISSFAKQPRQLTDCIVTQNTVLGTGASLVTGSEYGIGGGGALIRAGSVSIHIEGWTISGNVAHGVPGGGLAIGAGAPVRPSAFLGDTQLVIRESVIEGNTATTSDGGGLYLAEGTITSVRACRVLSNAAPEGSGGGIAVAGIARLGDAAVWVDTVPGGPGVGTGGSHVRIESCTAQKGGGMAVQGDGFLGASDVLFQANQGSLGGGMWMRVTADSRVAGDLDRIVFRGNAAPDGAGGGLFLCFLDCGRPLPGARGVDVVSWAVYDSNIGKGYGDSYASDGAQLAWDGVPPSNVTIGGPVTLVNALGEEHQLSVFLQDVFGQVLADAGSGTIVDLVVAELTEILPPGGTSVGGVALTGKLQQVPATNGRVVFPNAVLATEAGVVEGIESRSFLLHVRSDRADAIFVETVIRPRLCQAGSAPVISGGLVSCTVCPEGQFSDEVMGSCVPCPSGSFAALPGSTSCVPCTAGSYAGTSGQRECIACSPGEWSDEGADVCQGCPKGGYCAQGRLRPQDGWWDAEQGQQGRAVGESGVYYECPNPDACVDGQCARDYEGPLCDRCRRYDEDGNKYAKVGVSCAKCPSDRESVMMVAVAVVCIVAVMLYFVRSATKNKSEVSILLKISIDFMQMLALVSEFTSATRTTFSNFFNFTKSTTTSVNIFPVQCLWEYNYYDTFTFYALVPPLTVGVVGTVYALLFVWRRFRWKHPVVGQDGATERDLRHSLRKRRRLRSEYAGKFVSTLTVIYFLAYPSVVKHLLQVYPCHTQLQVLKADVRLPCDDATHRFYMLVGALALFVYCCVIPGTGFLVLRKQRVGATLAEELERRSMYYNDMVTIARRQGGVVLVNDPARADPAVLGLIAARLKRKARARRHARLDAQAFAVGGSSGGDGSLLAQTHSRRLERYKFLIDGYRPHAIYWEMITVARKTLIVVVLVFLVDSRITQAVMGLAVLMGFALAHVHVLPFVATSLNSAEISSLTVLIVTLSASVAVVADDSNDNATMSPTTALFLIVLNLTFLLSLIVYAVRFCVEHWKEMKWEKSVFSLAGLKRRIFGDSSSSSSSTMDNDQGSSIWTGVAPQTQPQPRDRDRDQSQDSGCSDGYNDGVPLRALPALPQGQRQSPSPAPAPGYDHDHDPDAFVSVSSDSSVSSGSRTLTATATATASRSGGQGFVEMDAALPMSSRQRHGVASGGHGRRRVVRSSGVRTATGPGGKRAIRGGQGGRTSAPYRRRHHTPSAGVPVDGETFQEMGDGDDPFGECSME